MKWIGKRGGQTILGEGDEIILRLDGHQIGRSAEQGGVTTEPLGALPAIDRGHMCVTFGVRANNRSDL